MMRRFLVSCMVFLALPAGLLAEDATPVAASHLVHRGGAPVVGLARVGVLGVADVPAVAPVAAESLAVAQTTGLQKPLHAAVVPFHKGHVLPAVETPVVLSETLATHVATVVAEASVSPSIAVHHVVQQVVQATPDAVYMPGTVVAFQVPSGLATALVIPVPRPQPVEVEDTQETEEPVHTEAVSATHGVSGAEVTSHTTPVPRSPVAFMPAQGPYADALADMLQATAEAPDSSRRQAIARANLAAFYLAWQRPEEALGVFATLPARADGLPDDPLQRLLMGVATVAAHREAPLPRWEALFDQTGALKPHARLWHAVALAQSEDYAAALPLFPTQRGLLPVYPDYLRQQAQLAQVATMVTVGNKDAAQKMVDALVAAYGPDDIATADAAPAKGKGHGAAKEGEAAAPEGEGHGASAAAEGASPHESQGLTALSSRTVPVALVRWQGIARLGTPKEFQGLKYLAKASEDVTDPVTAYRAKFDFIQVLRHRKELTDDQTVDYLTRLGMEWRGDSLEREVLKALADVYDRQGRPREALTTWRTLVKAYPTLPDMPSVTNRMTETFLRAFDPENPKTYDTLTYLGLYYDFRELVPNDPRGDAVYEQVATLLEDVTLHGRAAPLVEQQLNFRTLDASTRARMALLLARGYRNVGRSGDGLQILDKYKRDTSTTVLARDWKQEEAALLLDLERPAAAARALTDGGKTIPEDAASRNLLVQAYWQTNQPTPTIPVLQQDLAALKPEALVSDTAAQLAVFRLGYAYGVEKNMDAFNALLERYKPALSQLPALSDSLGAVAASSGISASIPSSGGLAPIAQALNGLNGLTARVTDVRAKSRALNENLETFDQKMRYLELLPPPVM